MMERLGKPKNQLELKKMIREVDSTNTGNTYCIHTRVLSNHTLIGVQVLSTTVTSST